MSTFGADCERVHDLFDEVDTGRRLERRGVVMTAWHDQEPIGLAGVERDAFGRTLDRQPRPAEDQQVEIELARTPAIALLAANSAASAALRG